MNISVLMSVYHKEKPEFLRQALDSIINQTIIPEQIVIVKDGHLTDELDKVINTFITKYPKLFTIVSLEENEGLGVALNIGIQACRNELIARMDTDDISRRDRFELQAKAFEKDSKLSLLGSNILEFEDSIDNILGVRNVPQTTTDIYKKAKLRNPFNHMTVMFKKQAVLNAGNYQGMLWFEDYYLWLRMINNNIVMRNLDQELVYARAGNDMLARRGGYNYICKEVEFQRILLQRGFINIIEFARNVLVRTAVRVMPKVVRGFWYKTFLRG